MKLKINKVSADGKTVKGDVENHDARGVCREIRLPTLWCVETVEEVRKVK